MEKGMTLRQMSPSQTQQATAAVMRMTRVAFILPCRLSTTRETNTAPTLLPRIAHRPM
jgi:hypothetical protein